MSSPTCLPSPDEIAEMPPVGATVQVRSEETKRVHRYNHRGKDDPVATMGEVIASQGAFGIISREDLTTFVWAAQVSLIHT